MSAHLRRTLTALTLAGALAGAVLSACQAYEADGVVPVALKAVNKTVVVVGHFLKPKAMLVVDRSGSMTGPVSGVGNSCTDSNGAYSASSPNDCKWKNLRDAFAGAGGLLPSTTGVAFGLTIFPGSGADSSNPLTCSPGTTLVPLSDTSDNNQEIADQLNAISPKGGTPTAQTLESLLSDPQFATEVPNQVRAVLLLTDGMPNCNGSNDSLCQQCAADLCRDPSVGPCYATFQINKASDCQSQNPCLDGSNTVAAVQALADHGILTFIIGFGQDTNKDPALSILNDAAVAGGKARSASLGTRFYQANTLEDLKKALADFGGGLPQPCDWTLDPVPTSDQVLEVVRIDSANNNAEEIFKQGTDYDFDGAKVTLRDLPATRCAEVKAAAPNRFSFQFRYVANL